MPAAAVTLAIHSFKEGRLATSTPILKALLGKKVLFSGRFDYGVEDRLRHMAEAQQATIADDVDAKTTHVVLADPAAGKTVQKKINALNAKGASIQVLDAGGFEALVMPTEADLLALIRAGGAKNAQLLAKVDPRASYWHGSAPALRMTLSGHDFAGADLCGFDFHDIGFERCSFKGATLSETHFASLKDCDFSKATGRAVFDSVADCRFIAADLAGSQFGEFADCDFTSANVSNATFSQGTSFYGHRTRHQTAPGLVFKDVTAKEAEFNQLAMTAPVFDGADLSGANLNDCKIDRGSFRGANLSGAILFKSKLPGADFTGANLTNANLSEGDLAGAQMSGADLAGAFLRGVKLSAVDFSKARNFDPNASAGRSAGPRLKELDTVVGKARRIQFSFRLRDAGGNGDGEAFAVDSASLKWGYGISGPAAVHRNIAQRQNLSMSEALLDSAQFLPGRQVRFETLDVSSTKSPVGGKELRELVQAAVAEAFAQSPPAEEELAKATKAWREQLREQGAADRERREKLKQQAEKQKQSEKKKIAKKIEKEVGKVTDVMTFLKALELRIEKPKIDKATKMLKASRFKLFNDVAETHLAGVVKSQTDPDLVYACRIESDGHYACCTQNLNICGGLRGSICKHLLVLIIGLVNAGELDPTEIDAWIARTHDAKPELDKEVMGEIFIRYKGAEAGEVDWRPTETVPEDYYAV